MSRLVAPHVLRMQIPPPSTLVAIMVQIRAHACVPVVLSSQAGRLTLAGHASAAALSLAHKITCPPPIRKRQRTTLTKIRVGGPHSQSLAIHVYIGLRIYLPHAGAAAACNIAKLQLALVDTCTVAGATYPSWSR